MVDVRIENLTKVYGDKVVAVDDVSIDVADGEFVTLVGPSGSGKSTILRALAGLVGVTDGHIYFGSKDVTMTPPQQRDVAMVFQNYALYPNMTVRGNMEFGLKMKGMPKDERNAAVEEAAEMLQIGELLKRDIQQLSGGQQQRVALGRSLVRDPDVFLLDEPLANLDAKLRIEMRATLVELQRKLGATTVYVTHNQIEAMTMSDRVAVLHDGVVQQLAEPQELYKNPANRFVGDFIGTPSMNFLDCDIAHRDGTVTLETDMLDLTLPPEEENTTAIRGATEGVTTSVIGIRPQHLSVHDSARSAVADGTSTQMEVAVVETAGEEYILHLDKNDIRIQAVVDEETDIERGDIVTVEFPPRRLHIFDRANGEALV